MFFTLKQIVYFLHNSKIKSGKIVARSMVEYTGDIHYDLTVPQLDCIKGSFKDSHHLYVVCFDSTYKILSESELFSSKEGLLDYIQSDCD